MRRKSIYVDAFSHENPVPAACVVDNTLISGWIHGGVNGAAQEGFAPEFSDQCKQMFATVHAILEAAGGSLDDLLKLEVNLQRAEDRPILNEQWSALFPDAAARPARSVTIGTNRPHIQIQCQITAILDSGKETTHG